MSGKTLLFLGANQLHAHTWQAGVLSAAQRFADNPDGREQFAAFLQTHRDPAYLLTDLIEEDFRQETVPHLRGSERTALIQRKFEQYYRNTPFRRALLQQRQKEGRRDDEMLFSALTNPARISPWLNIMLQHIIPLAGIYSVPDISSSLVKGIPSDHILLLSWEKPTGLRQTYFNAGHLHFSRLTTMGSGSSFSDVVASETARTQQYLNSLSLLPPGHALDVTIICHVHDRRELEAHLHDSPGLHYAYLDIQQLGQRIKSRNVYADSDATPLLLHLLATSPPRSHYAAAEHTHFFQLWQLRRSLLWLSAVLAAGSLLWSAVSLWQGGELTTSSAALRMQVDTLSQQAEKITLGFPSTLNFPSTLGVPGTLATATDMKTAVLLSRKLGNYSPPPQKILDDLSKTLDAYPRIRVGKLSWQMSAAAEPLPADGTAATLPAQVILLSGELEGLAGDYRGALNYMERFQQALTQRGHLVTALTLPLDISPQGSIAADEGKGTIKPAQFALKIIWRPQE